MVMTDSRESRTEDQQDDHAGEQVDEVMLTTGEAANVIGFGTTRKQVIAMIADGAIAFMRPKRGAWARIPLSAALTKRRELEEFLAESEAAAQRWREKDAEDRRQREAGED